MDVEKQVLMIWAANNGHTDDIPVHEVRKFEAELLRFVENSHPGVLQALRDKKAVTEEIEKDLEQLLKDFKDLWAEKAQAAAV
jgi:F-type H+-transporting ATPase subunit alpha